MKISGWVDAQLRQAAATGSAISEDAITELLALVDSLNAPPDWTPTHRHYKGGLYQLLFEALYEPTAEPMIVYKAQNGDIWIRRKEAFEEEVEEGLRRFAPIAHGAEMSNKSAAKRRPTKAQIEFLKQHVSPYSRAKNGVLAKFDAHKTYVFVARCRDAGLVEIIDPDDRFPYNWAGTRITAAGRAFIKVPK